MTNRKKYFMADETLSHRGDLPLQRQSKPLTQPVPLSKTVSLTGHADPFTLAMTLGGTTAFALTGDAAALIYPDPPFE